MGINAVNNNAVNTNQYDLSLYDKFAKDESGKSLLGRFSRSVAKLTEGGNSHTIEPNKNDRVHAFKRDEDTIASNNKTRAGFLKALINKYDGWNEIPLEVRKKINLDDFCKTHEDSVLFEAQLMGSTSGAPDNREELFRFIDAKVDSGKPLTARRINKVMAEVNKAAAKLTNPIMKEIKSIGLENLWSKTENVGGKTVSFFSKRIGELKDNNLDKENRSNEVFKASMKMLFKDFFLFMIKQLPEPESSMKRFDELDTAFGQCLENGTKIDNGDVEAFLKSVPKALGTGTAINVMTQNFFAAYNAHVAE